MRPRAGSSAKALLLTILGEFVLTHDAAAWTSTVVRSLELFGVEERNARQAVARLAEQGIVRSEKDGRKARWRLTDDGRHLLTVGTERIYSFEAGGDDWDGRWLVVLCSVPEEQRAKRHQLRSQLGFAGFGFLAPGVAVSPHLDREPAANTVLKELDLLPGATVLRAETGELIDDDELLRRAWDLDTLASAMPSSSTTSSNGRRLRTTRASRRSSSWCTCWRRFPFVDPEIPRRLLPGSWPGRRAKELFDERHEAWTPAARTWYEDAEQVAQ